MPLAGRRGAQRCRWPPPRRLPGSGPEERWEEDGVVLDGDRTGRGVHRKRSHGTGCVRTVREGAEPFGAEPIQRRPVEPKANTAGYVMDDREIRAKSHQVAFDAGDANGSPPPGLGADILGYHNPDAGAAANRGLHDSTQNMQMQMNCTSSRRGWDAPSSSGKSVCRRSSTDRPSIVPVAQQGRLI
jgi:hypothetical protein